MTSEQGILNLQVKRYALGDYFDHVHGIADKTAGSKVERGHQHSERLRQVHHTVLKLF